MKMKIKIVLIWLLRILTTFFFLIALFVIALPYLLVDVLRMFLGDEEEITKGEKK